VIRAVNSWRWRRRRRRAARDIGGAGVFVGRVSAGSEGSAGRNTAADPFDRLSSMVCGPMVQARHQG